MAELVLGVAGLVGTIDVCIKWGSALSKACQDYRDADTKLEEIIVRVQTCWLVILGKLEITKSLENTMPDDHREVQSRMLFVLSNKLEATTLKLLQFDKPLLFDTARRLQSGLRFVRLREDLQESIEELESWQRRYKPYWFSMIKHAPPTIDAILSSSSTTITTTLQSITSEEARTFRRAFKEPSKTSQSVFIHEAYLEPYVKKPIQHSTALVATHPKERKQLIFDTSAQGAITKKDARDFARTIRSSNPFTSNVLSCKGVVQESREDRTTFLFRVPQGYTVIRSLRDLLLSGQAHDSLTHRFEMAKQLANAICYVHLYDFVHKKIHPENILSISHAEDKSMPHMAFLVGFQVMRRADGATYPVANRRWETELYQHPTRQGTNAAYYVMQHDIYSLGVCLLEIGLWESFISYGPDGMRSSSQILAHSGDGNALLKKPDALKDHLVSLSSSPVLRAKMGTKYGEVVRTCLTCLDKDNMDFGDEREFQDNDGIAVGVRYTKKVLDTLNKISL